MLDAGNGKSGTGTTLGLRDNVVGYEMRWCTGSRRAGEGVLRERRGTIKLCDPETRDGGIDGCEGRSKPELEQEGQLT